MTESKLSLMAEDEGIDAPLLSFKVFFSGLSFGLFGLVGAVLALTVFPVLYLAPIGVRRRQLTARHIVSWLFGFFIRFMEACALIKVRRQNWYPPGDTGRLIVANHPSLLDVVYLVALVPNANCLVKRAMFNNPFTAAAVRAAGYIRNDSVTLREECSASLAAGDSLIVFPEGTRTEPNKPMTFLRGTANIALAAQCDIYPVTIRSTPARLMKHQAWYQMSADTLDVVISTHPALQIRSYLDTGLPRSRLSRRITGDLEAFYRSV
ncbi:MAG: lysophospholipid acyltransferase family protein [Halioglobus sp.]